MSGRTAEDLKGQKKWTTVSNRMLMHIIRTKLGWDSGKTPRRFYGVPWPEQYAILFDLTRAAPPRTRTPNLSVEDMLRTYELAASGSLMPVAQYKGIDSIGSQRFHTNNMKRHTDLRE